MGKQEFSADVVVSTDSSMLDVGSLYGRLTVGTTPQEVKIGANKLQGRSTVFLMAHPDNSGYIYVGFDSGVSATNYGLVLAGAAAASISLDNSGDLRLWVVASVANQSLGVIEGKG